MKQHALSWLLVTLSFLLANAALSAQPPRLLFYGAAGEPLSASLAKGETAANFAEKVHPVQTGPLLPSGEPSWALEWADDGVIAWPAAGNMTAARGTLTFFWRPRYSVDDAPFVIFRVGYADHSSWDMAWARIDWNGKGFDAFVTDANLARTRVSFSVAELPDPARWYHIALAWDETQGIALYLNGERVAEKKRPAGVASLDFDTGLDSFGLAGRVLSPHQVQSRYNFLRGSDISHLAVFDAMLTTQSVAALMRDVDPRETAVSAVGFDKNAAWQHRYGWDKTAPPQLSSPHASVKKIEFTDARDIKQWMFKGVDGIAETTWPGVYNRSRLAGRNDYFQLPDWNTYVEGGVSYDLTLPDEPVNLLEIRGAAFGELKHQANANGLFKHLSLRRKGAVRTSHKVKINGGLLRFSNEQQETPIQEIWAYRTGKIPTPQGEHQLVYSIDSEVKADYENLSGLHSFIAGRYSDDARQTLVALPAGASLRRNLKPIINADDLPLVHILVPSSVSYHPSEKSVTRSWAYGYENSYEGLDGIELSLPAMALPATHKGLIAFNLQIKDPIWPERNLLDYSFSIKPNQAQTLWIDLRDRILSNDSFYLTLASSAAQFNAASLNGAQIKLVFKPRDEAKAEHITDRFNQVKDNWGNLVEEHTSSQRMANYRRAHKDVSDLLRVDPEHYLGRLYWYYMNFKSQKAPPTAMIKRHSGVPFWVDAQLTELALARDLVNWWIDERQASFGDFGGGLSDDTDLVQQWPALALMGLDQEKITQSLIDLVWAVDKNDMMTDGLSTIESDELHVYEEGVNANSALFTLLAGDPVAYARLMATASAMDRIIQPNPYGHLLFASNWYGAKKIYRGTNWSWQKPYSIYMTHPAFLMADYAKDEKSRAQIIALAEAYLAHAYTDEKGVFTLPNEINWHTGETRGGELNRGAGAADIAYLFYAAYQWTGDEKFLAGINYRVARGGAGQLSRFSDNYMDTLNPDGSWRRAMMEAASATTAFENYIAWETTGNIDYLDAMYRHEVRQKQLHFYFHTEGHWWTDRVDSRTDLLQRARMGGIALVRNRLMQGHSVSWDFANDDASRVAILMPRPTQTSLTIIGFNTRDTAITGTAKGYNVTAGRWELTQGIDRNGDGKIDDVIETREVSFGRYQNINIVFAPMVQTIVTMRLLEADKVADKLSDLALSPFDIRVEPNRIELGVHNIGQIDSSSYSVELINPQGDVVQSQTFPSLAAPLDFKPKRQSVMFNVPRGESVENYSVRVVSEVEEIMQHNNMLQLDDANHALAF